MAKRPDPASFGIAALLTALCAYGPFSVDSYLPTLPMIARHFAASPALAQWTLSAFLLGQAMAIPIHGPLSDRYGRRVVLLGGGLLYVIASLMCTLAPSLHWLILGRFAQATGACCGIVVARAVVRDVYPPDRAGSVLSYMASATAIAPLVAPILGGFVGEAWGWQANFSMMTGFGMVLVTLTVFLLAETNLHPNPAALSPSILAKTYWHLFRHPSFLPNAALTGTAFGGIFAYISALPYVLAQSYGIGMREFGFAFAVTITCFMAGAFLAGRLGRTVKVDVMLRRGVRGLAAGGLISAALAWSGLHALPALLLPLGIYFFSAAFVIPNASALAIIPFPRHAGAASALLSTFHLTSGAITGVIMAQVMDGTAKPVTAMVALCGTLAWLVGRRIKGRVE